MRALVFQHGDNTFTQCLLRFLYFQSDSCNTCSAFNCDNCRMISGTVNTITDCSGSQYRGHQMAQDVVYPSTNGGGIINPANNNNYGYPGNSSCALPQAYSNCYAVSPSQGSGDGQRSWTTTSAVPVQGYMPDNNGNNQNPIATPDMYQFSPLSGDLFQPEEIFQLDQPLNQSKAHRLQTPPQTLLDLGSGTIQLKGTVVANNTPTAAAPAAHLNDSQYYSYESLPVVDTTPNRHSVNYSKCPASAVAQEPSTMYQYQGSINCGSEKLLNHFPTSGYAESCQSATHTTTLWKEESSDENGNNVVKSNPRRTRKDLAYHQSIDYYRSQDTYNHYQMGCHEAQQQQHRIPNCYNNNNDQHSGSVAALSPNASSTYFNQSSSSPYLAQGIVMAPDQGHLYTLNKSH